MPNLWCDLVYARWFLHAVEEYIEDALLEWCKGTIFLEFRIVGDWVDKTHVRRLINQNELLSKMEKMGYEIMYAEVSTRFSPSDHDQPLLMRVEGRKKR
jgi:hypothetical protein